MLTLIVGGARSGKSRYAQELCREHASVVYIATARVEDEEMRDRVACHRASRPAHWTTIEEPVDVLTQLRRASPPDATILLDCATTWLSNLAWAERDRSPDDLETFMLASVTELATAARSRATIIVSNELGSGLVPQTPVGRFFRDVHGLANQELARHASYVVALIAGLPLTLKGRPLQASA